MKREGYANGFPGGGPVQHPSDGLGFGDIGSGVGNSTNLPPNHNHNFTGPWSGNNITDEKFTNRVKREKMKETSTEELMDQIKQLIKIDTRESVQLAQHLKEELDDRMRRMQRARRAFQRVKTADNIELKRAIKEAPFTKALFTEHDLSVDLLDKVQVDFEEIPTELIHYALHEIADMLKEGSPKMETLKKNKKPLTEEERKKVMDAGAVWHHGPNGAESPAVWKAEVNGKTWYVCNTHRAYQCKDTLAKAIKAYEFIETTAQTAQPIKGKCPESGEWVYMSQSDMVQNNYEADCPEGKVKTDKLKNKKSIPIKEYTKKKKKKKESQLEQTLQFSPEEQAILDKIKEAAQAVGVKAYLVGGAVRDRLLGKENADLDFMVEGAENGAEQLVLELVERHGLENPVKYDRSQAVNVVLNDQPLDFINAERIYSPLRKDDPEDDSLEGEEEFTASFDDMYRRDLTINALMYDLEKGKVYDPTGKGIKDLKERKINTIISPFIKFKIHASDILRALRFAATLDFDLGEDMAEAMRQNAERLTPRDRGGDISNRRIRRELRKAIDDPQHWAKMRELLEEVGLSEILAGDISDVQTDMIGGIEYQFDDETKTAGIFDFMKRKKDDKMPSKADKIRYITRQIDEVLAKTKPAQQRAVLERMLLEWKLVPKQPEAVAIMSLLKNYKPSAKPERKKHWTERWID